LARGKGGDDGEHISLTKKDDRGARKHPDNRENYLDDNNNIDVEMKRFKRF